MKKLFTSVERLSFTICIILFTSSGVFAQHYEWAFALTDAKWGQYGAFTATDRHLNGYFIGTARTCQLCMEKYVHCYNPKGQLVWGTTFIYNTNIDPVYPNIYAIDADHAENRYLLMKFPQLPYQVGNFSITDSNIIVKYNKFGVPVRVTVLPELNYQLKTDSLGNMFVSNGSKVKRYNRNGVFVWDYNTTFQHGLDVDDQSVVYLLGIDSAIALNINGILRFNLNEQGFKTIDPTGKLYISTSAGLSKYKRNGIFQWIRPNITGSIRVNRNGNIYETSSGILRKYNAAGTVALWQVDDPEHGKIMNDIGNFYVGGNFDMVNNNIMICPFQLPEISSMDPWDRNQVWMSKFNTNSAVPFQAAVYTGRVETANSLPGLNIACSGNTLQGNNGPLFTYCTSYGHSLPTNNVFSVEISDPNGDFTNAINLGEPTTAIIPDTLPISSDYRIAVVSSTPGVISYPNKMDMGGNYGIEIVPDLVSVSVSGNHSLCEGQSIQYEITSSDPSPYVSWYNLPLGMPYPPQGTTSLTFDQSGSYYAVVANYYCLPKSTSPLNLTVNPRPNPVVTASGPTSFCSGDSVSLNVSDIDMKVIRWRNNGVAIPGEIYPDFVATSTGNYTARIINSYGCARASTVIPVSVVCREGIEFFNDENIRVYPNPTAIGSKVNISGIRAGLSSLSLYDMAGRQWINTNVELEEGSILEFSTEGLVPGVYSVVLSGSGEVVTKRLVIVK